MNAQNIQNSLRSGLEGLMSRLHLHNLLANVRLPGFRFAETMSGTALMNGTKHDMVFRLSAEAPSLWSYLRDGRTHIAGTLTIKGVADQVPMRGELWIHLLGRQIRYEFSFRSDAGKLMTFAGQKDLSVLHLVQTLTNLPGDIRDEHGHEVARTKLRFRKRDLPTFLYSFRPMF